MSERGKEISRWLLVSLVLLQITLGLLLAQLYASSHNSLYNNGNWSVSKTRMWNGLIGSYAFLFDLQPLAGGKLNLAAWHGFQEVVSKREVDPVSVEFDYRLIKPRSYLTFSFNRAGGDYTSIRLGRNPHHPPALLKVSADGEFFLKKRLRMLRSLKVGSWHTLRVEFGDDRISVSVDGRPVRKLVDRSLRVQRPQRIGFRGGDVPGFVDNVRIVLRDGTELVDTFNRPSNWLKVTVLAIGGLAILTLSAFLLLRRITSTGDKHLLFFFLMFTVVLIVVCAVVLALASHVKGFYPNASEKLRRQEAYWKDASAEKLFEDVASRYSSEPEPGVHRFIVLGASQTAGAGAPTEQETWVRRAERRLNERTRGLRYQWINGAVRGYVLKEMVHDFENRWVHWNPKTLLVNASHNDRGAPERFEKFLIRLVKRARERGIEVVLIQEPNADPRLSDDLARMHAIMAEIGNRYGIPVIDIQTPLTARGDDGFLWWDRVHMTTLGQRLFAEALVEELARRGVVEIETAPDARPRDSRDVPQGVVPARSDAGAQAGEPGTASP